MGKKQMFLINVTNLLIHPAEPLSEDHEFLAQLLGCLKISSTLFLFSKIVQFRYFFSVPPLNKIRNLFHSGWHGGDNAWQAGSLLTEANMVQAEICVH